MHRLERRAAEERGREVDAHCLVVDRDVLDHAELDERDDRDLRVGNLAERGPHLFGGHHCAPGGAERLTIVISSHSSSSSRLVDAARDRLDIGEGATQTLLDAPAQLRPEVVVEDAERVGPELVDRLAQPLAPLLGGEKPLDPHLGVQPVICLLAVHLPREAGDLGVVGGGERGEPELVGGLVEPVARDRARPLEPP